MSLSPVSWSPRRTPRRSSAGPTSWWRSWVWTSSRCRKYVIGWWRFCVRWSGVPNACYARWRVWQYQCTDVPDSPLKVISWNVRGLLLRDLIRLRRKLSILRSYMAKQYIIMVQPYRYTVNFSALTMGCGGGVANIVPSSGPQEWAMVHPSWHPISTCTELVTGRVLM
eukprot:8803111-Pyramimonas_sp.AAC.1